MFKKITATIVAISMIFSLTACNKSDDLNSSNANNNNETSSNVSLIPFDDFVDTLPSEFIQDDAMDLNFLFLNPQNYGFEETLLTLPQSTDEEIEQSIKDTIDLLAKLREYDKSTLSDLQKLTYDVVEHYLNEALDMSNYGYLDRGFLGSFVGYQAQLPLLLNEFTFNKQQDLDSYFNILEEADQAFQSYAEIEATKIEQGIGMPQIILDKVIEQCENFTKEEDNFLIDAINQRIDNMDFLTEDEKIEAKEKNETLISVNFRDAYKNLGESLKLLDGRDDDNGLWSLPNGKDYYQDVLQFYTGTSMTVKEIELMTNENLQNTLMLIQDLYLTNFEEVNNFLSSGMKVAEFDTVYDNINFFGEKLVEDFPSIGELNYTVTPVPKEMQENFSPAAYVVSQLDSPLNTPESIYLNGNYDSSLYATIAHEGYPGHMYQNAFYKLVDAPAIRFIIDYPGYSEGWATYVENNSVKYSDLSDVVKTIWTANNVVSQMYYVLMDIDLHYNGLERAEFNSKYGEIFGVGASSFNGIYDLMLETPGNYPKYFFCAMMFQKMYDETEIALGDLFSSIDFHNVILTTGSAPFDILQSQLDIYIEDTLSNATETSDDTVSNEEEVEGEIQEEFEELGNVA